jgi:hypothetical protein
MNYMNQLKLWAKSLLNLKLILPCYLNGALIQILDSEPGPDGLQSLTPIPSRSALKGLPLKANLVTAEPDPDDLHGYWIVTQAV